MQNTLVDEVVCKCKNITLADIEDALHSHARFENVEKEFSEVQKITGCSTGCGGCYNKVLDVISSVMMG